MLILAVKLIKDNIKHQHYASRRHQELVAQNFHSQWDGLPFHEKAQK